MKFSTLRIKKPGKTWIILGVAIGIGLLAALAAKIYLSNQMEAIEARGKSKTVNVIVAKKDVAKGEKLSSENIAIRAVPVEYAHSVAIVPDDFERVNGQVIAYPVKAGEMILWALMETQKVPTFSARVDPGRRAMTVPVDEINSISGLIEPGDVIDLMVTLEQKGKKMTFPLLQSVQVMATGQHVADDPKSGERRQYSTVTLNTTPEQSQNLIVARDVGKLTALLRNPQDTAAISSERYDLSALLGLQEGGRAAARTGDAIPVLYGSTVARMPPEAMRLNDVNAPKAASAVSRGAY
jgi:pilus assembly protein CpaB